MVTFFYPEPKARVPKRISTKLLQWLLDQPGLNMLFTFGFGISDLMFGVV